MESSHKGQHNLAPTKFKPSFKALSGVFSSQTLTKTSLTPILPNLIHGAPVQTPVSLNFPALSPIPQMKASIEFKIPRD